MKKKEVLSEESRVNIQDIWPQERDIFFRPERLKYVRRLIKTETCVFCDITKSEESFESLCLYKDESVMVVLNKFPYNSGHLLILPREHQGHLSQLSSNIFQNLMGVLHKSMDILEKAYQCQGINIGMNHGRVAGAGIPEHLHWHVIPRWMGDTNFFPLIAETKVQAETLEQSYSRLKEPFAKLKSASKN